MENNRNWFYFILQIIFAIVSILLAFFKPVAVPVVFGMAFPFQVVKSNGSSDWISPDRSYEDQYLAGARAPAGETSSGIGSFLGGTLATFMGSGVSSLLSNLIQRNAIERQNEYNSPKNQMARLKEAGLNPNLIYGNGSTSTGNQTSLGDYQGISATPQDILTTLNSVLAAKNLSANARKTLAEAAKTEQEVYSEIERTGVLQAQNNYYNQHAQSAWFDREVYKTGMLGYYNDLTNYRNKELDLRDRALQLDQTKFDWSKDPNNPLFEYQQGVADLYKTDKITRLILSALGLGLKLVP